MISFSVIHSKYPFLGDSGFPKRRRARKFFSLFPSFWRACLCRSSDSFFGIFANTHH